MMKPKLLTTALTLLFTVVSAKDDTVLTVSDATCDSPWSLSSFTTSCGGDSSSGCGFGDKVDVSGTIDIESDFDGESEYEISLGITMFNIEIISKQHNLCDCLTASEGLECGEAGTYTFDTTVDIPKSSFFNSVLSFMSVGIHVKIGSITSCDAKVSQSQNSSTTQSESAMTMTFSVIASASLLGGLYVLRKRRLLRTMGNEQLSKALAADFEMTEPTSSSSLRSSSSDDNTIEVMAPVDVATARRSGLSGRGVDFVIDPITRTVSV